MVGVKLVLVNFVMFLVMWFCVYVVEFLVGGVL